MRELLAAKIKKEFKKTKSRYEKKYGAAIFDAGVKFSGNGFLLLEGRVLSQRQKQEAFLAAKEILEKNIYKLSDKPEIARRKSVKTEKNKIALKNKIKVVANPGEKLEIGWAVVKGDVVDMTVFFNKKKRKSGEWPASASSPASTRSNQGESLGVRATQALKGDIVRLLAKKAGRYLIQTSDLAIGWVKKEDIAEINNASLIRKWKKMKRVTAADEKMEIIKTKSERKKFVAFLRKYFNAPYLMGGVTEKGIDCSSLVQKLYLEIFKILLPRHSIDQAALGREINSAQSRFGDLVFLRHREKKYPHIGIVVDANGKIDNFLILNARRGNGGVTIQSLSEILKSYKLIGMRRIIEYFEKNLKYF